jgi:hypothetical protein
MSKQVTIFYPTKQLEEEKRRIRDSVEKALCKLTADGYHKSLGLLPEDPPALFRWRLKQTPWHDKTGDALWPDKAAYFKKVTLRNVVEELTHQAESDEQLEQWLRGMLAPFPRHVDRLDQLNNEQRFLLLNWIAPDDHSQFFLASLCFYSNLALAQALYFQRWQEPLPPSRLGTEEKTAAKKVERLGLLSAKKRVIREMLFKEGRCRFAPFANLLGVPQKVRL